MTQTISMNPLRRVRDQSGMAFALALFAMLMLTLIGYGLAVSSQGAIRVGTGFKSQKLAFEAAEGGLEYARERLRTQRAAKVTFGTMLDAARNGGALVESTSIDDFLGSNGVVNRTANLPFVGSVGLGASAFQVFLTNDPADGISSGVDTNSTVTLTSFGSGPNAVGYSVVQAEVRTAL
ncbi:MAG: hypothetical protein QOD06_229, partial [Candidatus Binatota bacterium]|nr:hypothetical protein [Candidatus Binatota bacterium]